VRLRKERTRSALRLRAKPGGEEAVPCCSCPANSALAFHIESNSAVGPNGVASPLYACKVNHYSASLTMRNARRTNLDERRIHLTAHTFPNPTSNPRRGILFPRLGASRTLCLACASAVTFVEKVLLEEWVVEECLEDGGEEACL
jgi:hypothetical protein